MLLGTIPGTIGETSVIAIIIGAIFLILTGVIDLRIPGTYIVTFVIFVGIFGQFTDAQAGLFDPQYITAHLCGGCLLYTSKHADCCQNHGNNYCINTVYFCNFIKCDNSQRAG